MNYLQLAFRNILRHRKRTFVTVMTICLGFTAIGVMGGMLNNIFSRLKAQAIVVEKLGHLTFAKEGFFENGKMEPEKYLWEKEELDDILKILRSDEAVDLATPRLRMFGIASNGDASTVFITEAIEPKDDQQLIQTTIDGRVATSGAISLDQDASKRSEVAISSELSENLGLGEGNYLTLLTTTKEGMANAVDADIAQVYNTGNPATNDKFILTNFKLAQELYDTEGAERVVVVLKNPDEMASHKAQLLNKLNAAGHRVEVETWNERSLFYSKITKMFGVIFRVLTVIITVVVLLTLVNTMQMAVAERTREIGTMRSIGMLSRNVILLFCSEGILMAILGCLIAIPILLGISQILSILQISFIPPVASAPVPIMLILKVSAIVAVFVLFCVASLFSSFIASRKIAKQKVVDSLMQFN
ncbi:MAG: FtsX-like permease family protein [Bacteroidota bacterium]